MMRGLEARSHGRQTAAAEPATDTEIKLWNKDAIAFARDLLFVVAIFAYLIGFAFHSAAMSKFGIETNLSDQPVTSLITYAVDAIEEGPLGFAAIFACVLILMLLAGYLRHTLAEFRYYRPLVYGIVTLTVVAGLTLSYAWSAKAGLCVAERKWFGLADVPRVRVFPMQGVAFEGFSNDPYASNLVQLLAATNDTYQVLVTDRSQAGVPLPIAIPRSQVRTIEYNQFDPRSQPAAVHPSVKVPDDLPTPDAAMRGAGAAPQVVADLSDCDPGLAR